MADEDDAASGAKSSGHAAEALALGGASRAVADTYLEEQIRIAQLEAQSQIEQNDFELSHLRWRRFNDQMKGALQIMLVAIGALIVVGIAAAMWNASQADGIVVDAFTVPPSFATAGVGGDVIADDLTGKIAAIRDIANDDSLDNSKDVRKAKGEDIKVAIPETGVSLAEAWRYLRLWLGHESHLSGNLRDAGNGRIALTAALDGENAVTVTGAAGDLDKLEQQAAEHVFASVDPVNYVLYLTGMHRDADALAQAARATELVSDPAERADAYSLWGYEASRVSGDLALAIRRVRIAMSFAPNVGAPYVEIVRDASKLGHDEDALQAADQILHLQRSEQPPYQKGRGFDEIQSEAAFERDTATGDWGRAIAEPCFYCSRSELLIPRAEYAARMHDIAAARALFSNASDLGLPMGTSEARYFLDAATGDWRAAAEDARASAAALKADTRRSPRLQALMIQTKAMPLLAGALMEAGDLTGARAAIADTPRDCYTCIRVRGEIAALGKDRDAAARWFANAIGQAPSLPFAYSDWGRMLLAAGNFDGAIAKFQQANRKGPHFADPLELWGEALMLKSRSDLALAKFSEAEKYAPKWGRLHLKWGEALFYAGRKDEARKQFAIAAGLALTPDEKSELVQRQVMRG